MDTKKKIGFAITGSFCTFGAILDELERLLAAYDLFPILSYHAASIDTRFFKAEQFKSRIAELTGRSVVESIAEAEPIGPKKLLDALVVAPCTGNTAAKLALGIADTPVTLAAKAHLRNNRPLIIGISTNDGLSNNAKNIGSLINTKNIYFVPYAQDDPFNKNNSLIADFGRIGETVEAALCGKQLQPVIYPAQSFVYK